MNRTTIIACSALMLLTAQDFLHAQRGGGGSSDFRQRMMERMDRNGDGKLDEGEVPEGRARDFVQNMSRQAGGNGRFPLSISAISGGGGSDRGRGGDRGSDRGRGRGQDKGRDGDDRSRGGEEKKEEFEFTLVPRFGATVGGFGLDPRQLNNRMVNIEATYDDGVLRQLKQTMDRYDKDKDGVLDYKEWEGIPWQSDPRESDLNNDGNLTRAEMAERYKKTTSSRASSSSRSRERGSDRGSSDRGGSDRGSRGGDRGSDRGRGGDRGSSDRGGRGGTSSGFGGGPPSFGGRGGGDQGGRGGRGGGDRGGGGRSGFDPSSMITRLDKNGDGYIDFENEVDERTKSFASRFLPRYGIEVKGKQKLTSIVKKIQGGRSSSSSSGGGDNKKKGPVNPEMVASERTTGADKYGQHTYRKEKAEVTEDVRDWFGDKDQNSDGQVTMGEYLGKSPTNTTVKEFNKLDYNRDGILVPSEALKPKK